METTKILELLAFTLPALITGGVAYYLFQAYFNDQQNTRKWLLQKDAKKDALPLRLQAYERMTLFLERMSLNKLLVRITPISHDKHDYENYVIAQIEQEFEHNLTQQIYITNQCWSVISTAKNATIQTIRKANISEKVTSADKLREVLLSDSMENQSPISLALTFIKNEVNELW